MRKVTLTLLSISFLFANLTLIGQTCPSPANCDNILTVTPADDGTNVSQGASNGCQDSDGNRCTRFFIDVSSDPSVMSVMFDAGNGIGACNGVGLQGIYYDEDSDGNCVLLAGPGQALDDQSVNFTAGRRDASIVICRTGGGQPALCDLDFMGAPMNVDLTATKTDAIQVDVAPTGPAGTATPGDQIRYTITLTNNGNLGATMVNFTDTPDANTTLVVGSVTTSQGSVTTGNTGGDMSVAVDVGVIAPSGGSVTITFDVTVNNGLPSSTTQVANQGTVSGGNFMDVFTDDPDVGGANDPTVTPVQLPALTATKADAITNDVAPAGGSANDVITYTIVLANNGNADATGVVFNDSPGTFTSLNVGSVTTSQGSVTTGNTGGDNSVSVNVGSIAPAGSVTITFAVTIDNALPLGLNQVSNQGLVQGNNFPNVVTDDPGTGAPNDPTDTPVTVVPGPNAIPTMGEWAFLLFSLGLFTLSIVGIYNLKKRGTFVKRD